MRRVQAPGLHRAGRGGYMERQPSGVLVIPDVHLKTWMFDRADSILESGQADMAVCLGDIVDDWGMQFQLHMYEEILKRAERFHTEHPDTLWCIGNHDFSYLYGYDETGFSGVALYTAERGLRSLYETAGGNAAYIHRVNRCIFSHGGLSERFCIEYAGDVHGDIDAVIDRINSLKSTTMWQDHSPLWERPNYSGDRMFNCGYMQVVGHTPVEKPLKLKNTLITDTFSTRRNRTPIGNQRFIIVDTVRKKWKYAEE